VTTMRTLNDQGWNFVATFLIVVGPILALIIGYSVVDARRLRIAEREAAEEEAAEAALAPTFPVPPMDLVVPPSPRLVDAGVFVPAVTEGRSND